MTTLASNILIFQVRSAVETDRAGVGELLRAAKLSSLDPGHRFRDHYSVAFAETGQLVGAAGLELYGRSALLRSVVVAPEFRDRGLGARLMDDRLSWAVERGIESVYLLTTDALLYWQRHGFAVIERQAAPDAIQRSSQWSVGCSSAAVAMRIDLHPLASATHGERG